MREIALACAISVTVTLGFIHWDLARIAASLQVLASPPTTEAHIP